MLVQTDPRVVTEQLVNLVNKYKHRLRDLPQEDYKILLKIVNAAGFDAKSIVFGVLDEWVVDQDGSKLFTRPFNSIPFAVFNNEGADYFATGWLSDILILPLDTRYAGKGKENVVERVLREIERSKPLEPIQLTRDGDLLLEYPKQPYVFAAYNYFVDHTDDKNELSGCVGVHAFCNGWMDRHRASKDKDVITCRSCGLRVIFPSSTNTYGDLRKYLSQVKIQS